MPAERIFFCLFCILRSFFSEAETLCRASSPLLRLDFSVPVLFIEYLIRSFYSQYVCNLL